MRAVLKRWRYRCISKIKGSSNPHNVVKATLDALMKMRDNYSYVSVVLV